MITVQTRINKPIELVWEKWTNPSDIMQWNNASPDWHTPKAENDLRAGGEFSFTMAAKDGSFSFDFGGTYTNVVENHKIEYVLGDGRRVMIDFSNHGDYVTMTETFDPENENPHEMQQAGWQAILHNFKRYTEQ
jgi:uncharacterized protein YndB with AHSA1/START domain